MEIRWHKLVVTFPLIVYDTAALLAGFVVKYLEVNGVAILLEADHCALVVSDVVAIVLGIEGID